MTDMLHNKANFFFRFFFFVSSNFHDLKLNSRKKVKKMSLIRCILEASGQTTNYSIIYRV